MCKPIQPRKRKQPGTLASIWRGPVSFDFMMSELQRYGFRDGMDFRMTGPQFRALHHVLTSRELIRKVSLRAFYGSTKKTYRLSFSLRAASGNNGWERHLQTFEEVLPI